MFIPAIVDVLIDGREYYDNDSKQNLIIIGIYSSKLNFNSMIFCCWFSSSAVFVISSKNSSSLLSVNLNALFEWSFL